MTKMKSYRMNVGTLKAIDFLAEKLGKSKTEIIEEAIWAMISKGYNYTEKMERIEWTKDEFRLYKS